MLTELDELYSGKMFYDVFKFAYENELKQNPTFFPENETFQINSFVVKQELSQLTGINFEEMKKKTIIGLTIKTLSQTEGQCLLIESIGN